MTEADSHQWYAERDQNDFALSNVRLIRVEDDIFIANMIAQEGIRASNNVLLIRYDAVEKCLKKVAIKAKDSFSLLA